jgi:hypothetical protein
MHTILNSASHAPEPRPANSQAGIDLIATPQTRREAEDRGIEAGVAPLARASQAQPSSGVAIEDWDILLSAVKARLTLTVGEEPGLRVHDDAGRVRASVLECVAALDQLHTTMTHELDRRRQLESEVRAARAGE